VISLVVMHVLEELATSTFYHEEESRFV